MDFYFILLYGLLTELSLTLLSFILYYLASLGILTIGFNAINDRSYSYELYKFDNPNNNILT